MKVKRLYLQNFRIHKSFSFDASSKFVFLEGENGSGKTSILEALSLLTPGKGLRNSNFDAITKHNTSEWALFAQIKDDISYYDIGMQCNRNTRRSIRIDNKFVSSSSSLLEIIKVLWLTPAEDAILAQSKLLRRQLLDRLTYNFDYHHAQNITKYEYFLKSRIKLLKDKNFDQIWLSNLESNLAEFSLKISESRINTISRLKSELKLIANKNIPILNVICPVANNLEHISVEDIQQEFYNHRGLDCKIGKSLYGIHRLDFAIESTFNNLSAEKSSTGELKIMLFNIMLAQIKSLNKVESIKPLFLLDDILSHFGKKNIYYLFQQLDNIDAQIWISGTDFSIIEKENLCKNFVKILI